MSDSKETPSTEAPESKSGKPDFTPPASQADLDAIIKERVARERKKFEDYDDLKAKASRLDQIEEANKSEVEKAIARAEQAETRAVQAESRLLRLEIASTHGISKEDADLFLTATDEDGLTKQAKALAERFKKDESKAEEKDSNDPPRVGFGLPERTEGATDKQDKADTARAFFGL